MPDARGCESGCVTCCRAGSKVPDPDNDQGACPGALDTIKALMLVRPGLCSRSLRLLHGLGGCAQQGLVKPQTRLPPVMPSWEVRAWGVCKLGAIRLLVPHLG